METNEVPNDGMRACAFLALKICYEFEIVQIFLTSLQFALVFLSRGAATPNIFGDFEFRHKKLFKPEPPPSKRIAPKTYHKICK